MAYQVKTVVTTITPGSNTGAEHDRNMNANIMMLEAAGMEICNATTSVAFPSQQQIWMVGTIFYEPKDNDGDEEK